MFKVNRLNGTVINKFSMILHAVSSRIVMSGISRPKWTKKVSESFLALAYRPKIEPNYSVN